MTEEQKLIYFFGNEGSRFGYQGDHDDLTPAETAIRCMRALQLIMKRSPAARITAAKVGVI